MKKILVPLDGSDISEAVLPFVSTLAKSMEAEVILLRVIPSPAYETLTMPMLAAPAPAGPLPLSRPAPEHDFYAQGEGYLQRVAFDYFPDQNVTCQVMGGPTTDSILDFAAARKVDLIAMTTHGRSGFSRMVLGSVADEIVRRSHLPVFLVRPR